MFGLWATGSANPNEHFYVLWLLKQFFENLQFGLWDPVRSLFIRERNLSITETSRRLSERHYLREVMSPWYPFDRVYTKPEMLHYPFRMSRAGNGQAANPFPRITYAKNCTDGNGTLVPCTTFQGTGPVELRR